MKKFSWKSSKWWPNNKVLIFFVLQKLSNILNLKSLDSDWVFLVFFFFFRIIILHSILNFFNTFFKVWASFYIYFFNFCFSCKLWFCPNRCYNRNFIWHNSRCWSRRDCRYFRGNWYCWSSKNTDCFEYNFCSRGCVESGEPRIPRDYGKDTWCLCY